MKHSPAAYTTRQAWKERALTELSRSTLCDIMAGAAELLGPLAALLKQRLLASDLLGADDTPVRLLDGSHPQGVRTARFWLYRGLAAAPYNVFDFHESRSRDGPQEFLEDFHGWVKVDAYGVDGGVYSTLALFMRQVLQRFRWFGGFCRSPVRRGPM